jgi:hypothetical protein
MIKYEAKIIGETSAGLTAVEIYKNNTIIWSLDFFEQGASFQGYIGGLQAAYDTAIDCANVYDWMENDSPPIIYSNDDTTWVIASFIPTDGWKFAEPQNDGQSGDFIKTNADRIPADIVDAWAAELGI